jgi:hypothetical protein
MQHYSGCNELKKMNLPARSRAKTDGTRGQLHAWSAARVVN